MKDLIKRVLDHCGYGHEEPTEHNLEQCFLDYAASGIFVNLDYEETKDLIEDGDITLKMMCLNLLKVK